MELVNTSLPSSMQSELAPYVGLAYLLAGNAKVHTYQRGMFYDNNTFTPGFTVKPLHHYLETGLELEAVTVDTYEMPPGRGAVIEPPPPDIPEGVRVTPESYSLACQPGYVVITVQSISPWEVLDVDNYDWLSIHMSSGANPGTASYKLTFSGNDTGLERIATIRFVSLVSDADCVITQAPGAINPPEEHSTYNMLVSDDPTMLANHLSEDTQCIIHKEPELDLLTDLLLTMYDNLKRRDAVSAYVTMQAFLLVHRVICERLPIIGPQPCDIEVEAYAL